MDNIKHGDKVTLKSFHKTTQAPPDTADSENYWKLIGQTGLIISEEGKTHPAFPEMGERVLVKFDNAITDYGLNCHNEQDSNALWIFLSDLTKS